MALEKVYTLEEVGEYLRVGVVTARQYRAQGMFPNVFKQGKHWLVPEEDLKAVLRGKYGVPDND